MIVVDTNIIAYMMFDTPLSPSVVRLHTIDPFWHVPAIWKGEFLSITTFYFRKGLIDFAKALEISQQASQLIGVNEHRVSSPLIMEFVRQSACSSYDCEYVALAHELKAPLLTYDKQLVREFPAVAVTPEHFVSQFS